MRSLASVGQSVQTHNSSLSNSSGASPGDFHRDVLSYEARPRGALKVGSGAVPAVLIAQGQGHWGKSHRCPLGHSATTIPLVFDFQWVCSNWPSRQLVT